MKTEHLILRGNALDLPLADESVHMCVTSPPYWSLRDYGCAGQLGLEPTPQEYVANMVRVFHEIKRVLRKDGTLWLNIGDSFANKNLVGIPWMLAFALRDDGWHLRLDVIWSKPNPMRESVQDRPCKSHEYLFLLSKKPRYYYDIHAIRTKDSGLKAGNKNGFQSVQGAATHQAKSGGIGSPAGVWIPGMGANILSVWKVSTRSYKGAHFATFPPKLIEPCIKAGTSEKGCCPKCGAPWRRVTVKTRTKTRPGLDTKLAQSHGHRDDIDPATNWQNSTLHYGNRDPGRHVTTVETVGWESSCGHLEARDPVPCVVLDPFGGSGTTAAVADSLGRSSILVELNAVYIDLARKRLADGLKVTKPKRAVRRPDLKGQLMMF